MKRSKPIDEYLYEQEFRNVWYRWIVNNKMDEMQLHLCRQSYKAGYKLGKGALDG